MAESHRDTRDSERVRAAGRDAAAMGADTASRGFDAARDSAAGRARQTGNQLRDAAGQMQDDMLGGAMRAAADRLDELSDSLRNQDLRGLLEQVEGFARRQPGLFLGGMVALGFALGRFAAAGQGAEAARHGAEAARERSPSVHGGAGHHHDSGPDAPERHGHAHHSHPEDLDHPMASETRRQAIRDGEGAADGARPAGTPLSTQGGIDPQHRLPPTSVPRPH